MFARRAARGARLSEGLVCHQPRSVWPDRRLAGSLHQPCPLGFAGPPNGEDRIGKIRWKIARSEKIVAFRGWSTAFDGAKPAERSAGSGQWIRSRRRPPVLTLGARERIL